MIKKTLKTIKRAPVRAVAVLLFAAVISMIICALQASNEAELRNYEEALKSVPVTVTVKPIQETNGPQLIMPWVYDLFATKKLVKFYDVTSAKDSKEAYQIKPSEPSAKFSLSEYVTDIQVKMQQSIEMVNGIESKDLKTPLLYGITSISIIIITSHIIGDKANRLVACKNTFVISLIPCNLATMLWQELFVAGNRGNAIQKRSF